MYSDKVKVNEKPNRMRIRHGDVIIRSEYNDGVLRNNNRANNRLNNQMEMFDKAQRVIMKDLGKETQFIRNKMVSNTIASPRQQKHSPMGYIGTFNVNSKSTYTIKPKKDNETSREKKNKSTFHSLSDRSMYSMAKQGQRKADESRIGRFRPVKVKTENTFNGEINGTNVKLPSTDRKSDDVLSSKSPSEKRTNVSNSFTPRPDRKTDSVLSDSHRSNQMSVATVKGHKGGIRSLTVDSGRQPSAASRLSFIEILQKAEEAKSKGLDIEEHVPRPKTPELLSDYSSEQSEREHRRKLSHIGATPKSTYISHHM